MMVGNGLNTSCQVDMVSEPTPAELDLYGLKYTATNMANGELSCRLCDWYTLPDVVHCRRASAEALLPTAEARVFP